MNKQLNQKIGIRAVDNNWHGNQGVRKQLNFCLQQKE